MLKLVSDEQSRRVLPRVFVGPSIARSQFLAEQGGDEVLR